MRDGSKNPLQEHLLENLLARGSHYPVDAVSLEDAQPAQLVTLGLVEPQHFGVVARVHRREERDLCGAQLAAVVDNVLAARPLALGLDANVLGVGELPLRIAVAGERVPHRHGVVQREAGLGVRPQDAGNLGKRAADKVLHPHGQRAARGHDGRHGLGKVLAGQLRGRGRQRAEGKDARRGHGIGVRVELGDGGDVALDLDGAAHNDDLLGPEEGLGVLGRGEGRVGHGADGEDRDAVDGVLLEEAQNLLVRELPRGREERRDLFQVRLGRALLAEDLQPLLGRAKVWKRGMNVVKTIQTVYRRKRIHVLSGNRRTEVVKLEILFLQRMFCAESNQRLACLERLKALGTAVGFAPGHFLFNHLHHADDVASAAESVVSNNAGDGWWAGTRGLTIPEEHFRR
ncbi:hypothetical protein LLEC1_03465 [Akanthomyces lecanii]|uniref:Uncharacterized protein n=1 Tax=Cordyceps confragosa TaxID=2714763 RepID=A0A179IC32_CORDF|nr:hypothetical protein LLEC1_03465 [Akanthomyces lecanii]